MYYSGIVVASCIVTWHSPTSDTASCRRQFWISISFCSVLLPYHVFLKAILKQTSRYSKCVKINQVKAMQQNSLLKIFWTKQNQKKQNKYTRSLLTSATCSKEHNWTIIDMVIINFTTTQFTYKWHIIEMSFTVYWCHVDNTNVNYLYWFNHTDNWFTIYHTIVLVPTCCLSLGGSCGLCCPI